MSQRIGRRNGGERKSSRNGLLKLSRVAKGPYQPVMRFNMRLGSFWSRGDGGAEGASGFGWLPGGEQIMCALVKQFGGGYVGFGHGCH